MIVAELLAYAYYKFLGANSVTYPKKMICLEER